MTHVFDLEASSLHYEINDHLLDRHVLLAILGDLLSVHFGDRVDIGWWESGEKRKKNHETRSDIQLFTHLTEFSDKFSMRQDWQQQDLAIHFVTSFRFNMGNVEAEIDAEFLAGATKRSKFVIRTTTAVNISFFFTFRSLRTSLTVKFDDPELTTLRNCPLIRMLPELFSIPSWSIFSGSMGGSPICGMPFARYGLRRLNVLRRHELSCGSLLLHF